MSLSPINGLENFKKASVAINIPCLWHCELLQSVSKPALLLKCGEHRANISQKIWGAPASTALWLFQNPERFDGLCLESAYWPVATAPGSLTASLYVIVAALISSSTFSRSLAGAHPKRRSLSAAWRFLSAVSVRHIP